jgi:hypothetical protein
VVLGHMVANTLYSDAMLVPNVTYIRHAVDMSHDLDEVHINSQVDLS